MARPCGGRESDLTTKRTFEILSAPLRRRILSQLSEEYPNRATFEIDSFIRPDDQHEEVYTVLYHRHLPLLQNEEIIAWNRESGAITHGPIYEEIHPAVLLLAENRAKLPGKWV